MTSLRRTRSGKWFAVSDGRGSARPWYVCRTRPDGTLQTAVTLRGHVLRFGSEATAQKLADTFNDRLARTEGGQG